MKDIKDRIIEAHEDFEVLLNPYIEDIYKLMNKHDVGIAKSYLRELLDLKSQLHITTKDLQATDQAREENNV